MITLKKNLEKYEVITKNLNPIRWRLISNEIYYANQYRKTNVIYNTILLESMQGSDLGGNIEAVLHALKTNSRYKGYQVALVVTKEFFKTAIDYLNAMQFFDVDVILYKSRAYYRALLTYQYLLTDDAFPYVFSKKPSQIYVNFGHGTPMKAMGIDSRRERMSMGNMQRNYMMADYLVFPNEYTRNRITDAYMLNQVALHTRYLPIGYPRNDYFAKPVPEDTRINVHYYAYLPTWRGSKIKLQSILQELDFQLRENEILYVKLHPWETKATLDFSSYIHIKPFPSKKPMYDVLNRCECLLSDYSSVIFDYANRKDGRIVLFPFDEQDYASQHGLYLKTESLGLYVHKDIKSLAFALRTQGSVPDSFKKKYCTQSATLGVSTTKLLDHLLGYDFILDSYPLADTEQPVVLVYGGDLSQDATTLALSSFLKLLDRKKQNVILTFDMKQAKSNGYIIDQLPPGVAVLETAGHMNLSFREHMKTILFSLRNHKHTDALNSVLSIFEKNAQAEYDRMHPYLYAEHILQFNGRGYRKILIYGLAAAKSHTIFVQRNMLKEMQHDDTIQEDVLGWAYHNFEHVVLTSKDLLSSTAQIKEKYNKSFHNTEEFEVAQDGGLTIMKEETNFVVLNMPVDTKSIVIRQDYDVHFEPNTESTHTIDSLLALLNSCTVNFVTLGLFTAENEHFRLIEQFRKLKANYSNISMSLTIIGGYGSLYYETRDFAKEVGNVVCIKSLVNPYPILKKCTAFVSVSNNEGHCLSLLEAASQGLYIIATKTDGTNDMLMTYGGTLVANTNQGIYAGMEDIVRGKGKKLHINFQQFNQTCYIDTQEFLNLHADQSF
jgi:CDP-glycerol glycerophosphotransferase